MLNPYIPRPIDRPTPVPLDPHADLVSLDRAKIFSAPSDPTKWEVWRGQLTRWRADARRRLGYDGQRYHSVPADCFVVGMAWKGDELLSDHESG
ncbi:MAG: hypothetical protein ACRDP4_15905, partial [Nocardioidaceae bacterium]